MWHNAYTYKGPCGEMDFDEEFIAVPMIEQLEKVVDSLDNPHHIEWVTCDDGYQIRVTAAEAQVILRTIQTVPVEDRLNFLKQIQSSDGLAAAIKTMRNYN